MLRKKTVNDPLAAAMENERLRRHMTLLSQMPMGIGAALLSVARSYDVHLHHRPGMAGAMYFARGRFFSMQNGILLGADHMGAAQAGALAHELRHAWQTNAVPEALRYPQSPRALLGRLRMKEADARAIGGLTGLYAMRMSDYTKKRALDSVQDSFDRIAVQKFYDFADMNETAPERAGLIMRGIFELYMAHAPQLVDYEGMYVDQIRNHDAVSRMRHASWVVDKGMSLSARFNRLVDGKFTCADGVEADLQAYAGFLGEIPGGTGHNYLRTGPLMPVPLNVGAFAAPGVITAPIIEQVEKNLPSRPPAPAP